MTAVLEKPPAVEPIRLNIGAGPIVIDGWTPIDRKLGSEAYPLKSYADNSVDEIRASHILEHFGFRDVPKVLEEWKRVLKPGGRIRIAVPDFAKISATWEHEDAWVYVLMGGQEDSDDFHRSAYDEKRLAAYLVNAGLVNINHWESPNTDTAAHHLSLNLEAFKPQPNAPETQEISIRAVMSVPRIGWNNAWQTIVDTLRPFQIPVSTFDGVFWGQCMQRAMNEAIEDGVDWLLCIDYDSMVTPDALNKLIGWLGQRSDIDAIAPIQMRRGQDYPLMTIAGMKETEVGYQPMLVTTAHFGMTLIRMESLKKVPKPWFKGEPDKNGEWSDDKLDDDIWFWHQWRLAGNTIYIAPDSRIGHLELMVSDFDESMNPRHRHMSAWRKENYPEKQK